MARSRSIGGIYASLSLRDGGFSRGLATARKSINKFGSMALKSGAVAAGAMAAGLVVGTKGALSMVDAVGDLSAATGVGIADMMKLQRSYADGGRDAGKAAADIGKMQKSIFTAAKGGIDPFADLKLSAEELVKLSPTEQFEAIGDAISRIENPTVRTAKAMEIFGKSGAGLATVFGTLKDSERVLGNMPALAQKFGGAIDQANDALGRLPVKSDQFFVGFTAGIIGQLLPNLAKIDDYDFTTLGQNLGTALATGFSGLTDGTLFEIASLKGLAAFTDMAGKMNAIFNAVINTLGDMFAVQFTPQGNKTLLAMKAVALDFMTLGADPETKARIAKGNKNEWDQANNAKPFDPLETFKKYNSAGADPVFKGLADQMTDSADILWNNLKKKNANAQGRAAAIGAPEPIVNPLSADSILATTAASAPKALDVNEYQRRGLSLGGSISTPNKDELKTLQSIDKTLKEAKKTGTLTWD